MMNFKEKYLFLRKTLEMPVVLSLYYALTYKMEVKEWIKMKVLIIAPFLYLDVGRLNSPIDKIIFLW